MPGMVRALVTGRCVEYNYELVIVSGVAVAAIGAGIAIYINYSA